MLDLSHPATAFGLGIALGTFWNTEGAQTTGADARLRRRIDDVVH